jgi:hypothetical protein
LFVAGRQVSNFAQILGPGSGRLVTKKVPTRVSLPQGDVMTKAEQFWQNAKEALQWASQS